MISITIHFVVVVVVLGLDSTRAFQELHVQGRSLVAHTAAIWAATTTPSAVAQDDSSSSFTLDQYDTSRSNNNNNKKDDTVNTVVGGLYRTFAEHAWERLKAFEYLHDANVDPNLLHNQSPVVPRKTKPQDDAAAPDGSSTSSSPIVHMTVRALTGDIGSPIRYARYALLETLPSSSSSSTNGSIQVLNLVVFPNSNLPVWGADFVSLPGNKHLLLLDAQPMVMSTTTTTSDDGCDKDMSHHWNDWYQSHDIATKFPWGGDLPEKVQPFVSPFALWSRLGGKVVEETSMKDGGIQTVIDGPLYQAYCDHLDIYLRLVVAKQGDNSIGDFSSQHDYIAYRLENDPARPMLKRLFGEEWTERVLHEVLFPRN
jgi:Ferredoxin-dependent bilin reductase